MCCVLKIDVLPPYSSGHPPGADRIPRAPIVNPDKEYVQKKNEAEIDNARIKCFCVGSKGDSVASKALNFSQYSRPRFQDDIFSEAGCPADVTQVAHSTTCFLG